MIRSFLNNLKKYDISLKEDSFTFYKNLIQVYDRLFNSVNLIYRINKISLELKDMKHGSSLDNILRVLYMLISILLEEVKKASDKFVDFSIKFFMRRKVSYVTELTSQYLNMLPQDEMITPQGKKQMVSDLKDRVEKIINVTNSKDLSTVARKTYLDDINSMLNETRQKMEISIKQYSKQIEDENRKKLKVFKKVKEKEEKEKANIITQTI